MLCRFSLQHKQQLLGLPAGMCIKVKVGQQEQAYNPISTDETPGEVVILVKVRHCRTLRIPVSCSMHQLHSGTKSPAFPGAVAHPFACAGEWEHVHVMQSLQYAAVKDSSYFTPA